MCWRYCYNHTCLHHRNNARPKSKLKKKKERKTGLQNKETRRIKTQSSFTCKIDGARCTGILLMNRYPRWILTFRMTQLQFTDHRRCSTCRHPSQQRKMFWFTLRSCSAGIFAISLWIPYFLSVFIPFSGNSSVGTVCSQTQTMEFSFLGEHLSLWNLQYTVPGQLLHWLCITFLHQH
jgi:hypothetical protein